MLVSVYDDRKVHHFSNEITGQPIQLIIILGTESPISKKCGHDRITPLYSLKIQ